MPITIKNLHFGFDELEEPLFKNTTITLDHTWHLGLVGRNGRGKTTLLKLLLGQYEFNGEITSDKEFVYFPLAIENVAQLTLYAVQEVFSVEQWQLERECSLLDLDKDLLWVPFEQLSGGEQTKVMLAALFCDAHRFPLLDEPTNHLDVKTRKQVAQYLQKKQGFIVISHDRGFLNTVCDHILAIERSNLALYKGNFAIYEEQKKRQDKYEQEQNKQLKSEINRLQQTAREKAQWSDLKEKPSGNDPFGNAQAKRMMKRAKAIEKRTEHKIEEKTKLLKNIETTNALSIHCLRTHRNPLLRVQNFTLNLNGKPLFHPISFELFQGEQVAIIGKNGSGKTALLQYLLDAKSPWEATGTITMPNDLAISKVRQQHLDNTGTLKDFAQQHKLDLTLFLNHLRILGFDRDVFHVPIEQMSQGQQKKVELAKSLGTDAEIFLWDEPLNFLDIYNQQQLEDMITTYAPTLLFVEHDEDFVTKVASKIVELVPY